MSNLGMIKGQKYQKWRKMKPKGVKDTKSSIKWRMIPLQVL